MSATFERPTPKKLLKEAKEEEHQHPYNLLDYDKVIDTLIQKEFSYAKIAKWLSARLGGTIDRGQIYYVHRTLLKRRQAALARAALEELQEPAATAGNDIDGVDSPDPELEKMAEETEIRRLNAEADKEDELRKRKGRRKP
jgi:hypothetical protein